MFATKLKTDIPFLGREALEAARANGVRRRLVSFVVSDPGIMMWGGELLLRNGRGTGQVTGAAFGATVGACVGLAYAWRRDGDVVTNAYLEAGSWQVNVGGAVIDVIISLKPPYDPTSARIRA